MSKKLNLNKQTVSNFFTQDDFIYTYPVDQPSKGFNPVSVIKFCEEKQKIKNDENYNKMTYCCRSVLSKSCRYNNTFTE